MIRKKQLNKEHVKSDEKKPPPRKVNTTEEDEGDDAFDFGNLMAMRKQQTF